MNKYITGLIFGLIALGLCAQEPEFRDNVPDTHTVVKGDTLWDISNTFLKTPWLWPEIWHVNAQIENPHLIYPGDVIRLIYIDGKPRLTLDNSGRIFKLEPKAHVISKGDAIETIPLSEIDSFLSRSRIVGKKDLKKAPYVVSGKGQHLLAGKSDVVYVRGELDKPLTIYGVYREGEKFIDPETNEFLGIQALDIGSVEVREQNTEVATVKTLRTTQDMRIGDRLLKEEERKVDSTFFPSAPSGEIDGQILAVEGGVSQIAKLNVVVLNRGTREDLKSGDVLAVYKRGERIRDRVTGDRVRLPDERAGLIMVFRTFEKVSLALVLEASQGLRVDDVVRNP